MGRSPRFGRDARLAQVMQAVMHHGATTQAQIARHLGLRSSSTYVQSCVRRRWLEEQPRTDLGTGYPVLTYRVTDKGRAAQVLAVQDQELSA